MYSMENIKEQMFIKHQVNIWKKPSIILPIGGKRAHINLKQIRSDWID